ncbi:MAG TPA: Fur family transcriptional regulator [Candidatus Nanoarchaeia archaeon]
MVKKSAVQILKSNKIKLTNGRKEIMKVLEEAKTPLSPSAIFSRIKSVLPKANLTTIYRNLELLERKELIKKYNFNRNCFFYELIPDRPHHHHVICRSCGKIEDSKVLAEEFITKIAKSSAFKIEDHNFDFFGLCQPCQGGAL